ncbi:hypothetical protein CL689_04140 [Candidatus Saccharibacteria bacterium]|nr:hypothetical protein [Candidatus Saccharibacteria bacterium]
MSTTMNENSGSKKMMLIAGLLLATIALAGGAFFMLSGGAGGNLLSTGGFKAPAYVPMDSLIVNLADKDRERYVQVVLVLEAGDESAREALTQMAPVLRSRAMMVLSRKYAEPLKTSEGKQALTAELMDLVRVSLEDANYPNPAEGIKQIHYSTLVIQ